MYRGSSQVYLWLVCPRKAEKQDSSEGEWRMFLSLHIRRISFPAAEEGASVTILPKIMAISAVHIYINIFISFSNSILHMVIFQSYLEFPSTNICEWCLPPILFGSGLSSAIIQVILRLCSCFSQTQCPHLLSYIKKSTLKNSQLLKYCHIICQLH